MFFLVLTYHSKRRGTSNFHKEIRQGAHDFSHVPDVIDVFADSDWAGNKATRKNASCAIIFVDGQLVYSYARQQKTMALPPGEAEYYSAATAAPEGIVTKHASEFLSRRTARMGLKLDSAAAVGICARIETGRLQHLMTRTFVLQDLHKRGILSARNVGANKAFFRKEVKITSKLARIPKPWEQLQQSQPMFPCYRVNHIQDIEPISFSGESEMEVSRPGLQEKPAANSFATVLFICNASLIHGLDVVQELCNAWVKAVGRVAEMILTIRQLERQLAAL